MARAATNSPSSAEGRRSSGSLEDRDRLLAAAALHLGTKGAHALLVGKDAAGSDEHAVAEEGQREEGRRLEYGPHLGPGDVRLPGPVLPHEPAIAERDLDRPQQGA